jgi:predicted DNA-binding protein YlxM (UPF0122 family)
MVFIYTLSDDSGNVRYVGKTKQYLKQRLYSHIKESQTKGMKSHKISWIKSLLLKDERPKIEVVDEVPESDWQFWKKYWIEQFKQWGFKLTNQTEGGQGGNGYEHTEEAKERMRKAKLGTSLPKEHRENISKSVKDKSKEVPNYNKCHDKTHIINSDLLYQKYIIENLSLNKCANFFNTSKHTIFRNITEKGFKKTKDVWEHQLSTRPKKLVLQYDINDNFIREWSSPVDIKNELGFNSANISSCCRGVVKSANGYKWKYKDNI